MGQKNEQGRTAIDLNRASMEELLNIEGFNAERARLIIQRRDERGGFRSWDDVKAVQGIGTTLLAKLQQCARIDGGAGKGSERSSASGSKAQSDGSSRGRQAQAVASSSEESEDEDDDDEEELEFEGEEDEDLASDSDSDAEEDVESDDEIEGLIALTQLDAEAAYAYQIAIEHLDIPVLRDTLERFRMDHVRHVRDLNQAIDRLGGVPVEVTPDPEDSVLVRFTEAFGPMGPRAVLLAMIGNEQLTNATYDTALELVSDPQARDLIERNLDDERGHLKALLELRDRDWDTEEARALE